MLENIIAIARNAGVKIMEIYDSGDFGVEIKADNSPLTLADKAANEIIVAALQMLTPEIPIISEEGKNIPIEERRNWTKFWLVDPLDGTKEFVKRRGEFTVNIALIENQIPILGVVFAPVLNALYSGELGKGAFCEKNGNARTEIHAQREMVDNGLIVVRSKSHAQPEEDDFFSRLKIAKETSIGSSLKFCLVAEGAADLYFRFGPTSEWDTAAGHAVVLAAGGSVVAMPNKQPFLYNKNALLNGSFLCKGANVEETN